MTSGVRLCLLGLPQTGKTTYIAALWAYVTAAGPPDKYRVVKAPADATYLNAIAEAWANGLDMPRNAPGADSRIEFEIGAEGRTNLAFRLPDLPGEVFRRSISLSRLPREVYDWLLESDVLLFCVNADTSNQYVPADGHILPGPNPTPGPDGKFPDLNVEEADTDSLNSDLLQRIRYIFRDRTMPPIVLMVTAWDTVDGLGLTPPAWLATNQPQLAQLLDEAGRTGSIEVMGVSAAGGDPSQDEKVLEAKLDKRSWAKTAASPKRTNIAEWLTWFEALGGA